VDGKCDCAGTERDSRRLDVLRGGRVMTTQRIASRPHGLGIGIIEEFEPLPTLDDLFAAGRAV
jgi:hypothetical protein